MHRQLSVALRLNRDELDVAAGLRVGVSVVVPVVLALVSGRDAEGMVAALGALNLAMAEGVGNYSSRALTLGCVLIGNAVAVGVGTAAALAGWWGVPVLLSWALITAYVGVIGPVAERTGWFAALMFMIGLGLPEPSIASAIHYAGLVAAGGMWAVGVIVVLWPFHPHRPVLRSVGRGLTAVGDVLELAGSSAPVRERDRAVVRAEVLGHEAGAMTRWRNPLAGRSDAVRRLRRLATTAERARSDAVVLDRRLREVDARAVDVRFVEIAAMRDAALRLGRGLAAVGRALPLGHVPRREPAVMRARRTADEVARSLSGSGVHEPALRDLCAALASLTEPGCGQAVGDWLGGARRPMAGVGARTALRANLTRSSFWFRYAARFAIAAAAGLAMARGLGLERGYWVLITIAIVIKPGLSVSTTCTIHRVGGTVLGALLGVGLVVSVTDTWGLVIILFVLAVAAVSLTRVNYGLAVVFITPLVLVLLDVPHPGQWEIADIRVMNTLLGAAIGLLATTRILPGGEWSAVVDRSRVALDGIAAFVRAIAYDPAPHRLAARRAARVGTDELVAVNHRVINEPHPPAAPDLDASTRMAAAAEEMWEKAAELELAVPTERMTPQVRRLADAAADRLEQAAALLNRPGRPPAAGAWRSSATLESVSERYATTLEPRLLSGFSDAVQAVQTASAQLSRVTLG